MREIIRNVREIEKPEDLNTESETFILLDRPKDSVAEMMFYVLYQGYGSLILYNDSSDRYFSLSKEQTSELRSIIEQ